MLKPVDVWHEPETTRRAERMRVDLGATIRASSRRPVQTSVVNLSNMGFMIETAEPLPVDSLVRISLSGIGENVARVVWASGGLYGCALLSRLTPDQINLARTVETVTFVDFNPRPRPQIMAPLMTMEEHGRRDLRSTLLLCAIPWAGAIAALIAVMSLV